MNEMLRFLIIFYTNFARISNFINAIPEEETLQLQFVQALWRHGDRAALFDLYPISEANWTFGGGGFGELTPNGMAQMHQLGGLFRKRYVTDNEFLRSRYSAKEASLHVLPTWCIIVFSSFCRFQ
uniref:acid phosphatase n=1 Tax=Caenorhabditis japonica TaxID=281687 RepID=A0A8R1EFX9_CAEJA